MWDSLLRSASNHIRKANDEGMKCERQIPFGRHHLGGLRTKS
jgi:hypothetical protein